MYVLVQLHPDDRSLHTRATDFMVSIGLLKEGVKVGAACTAPSQCYGHGVLEGAIPSFTDVANAQISLVDLQRQHEVAFPTTDAYGVRHLKFPFHPPLSPLHLWIISSNFWGASL
jgi:hypothetical protein